MEMKMWRKKSLIRALKGTGFVFVGHRSGLSWRQFIGVPLLSGDNGQRFLRVMRGTHKGTEALLFDYRHRASNKRNCATTVTTLRLPFGRVPSFELRDRLTSGGQSALVRGVQVGFDDHPDFTERFEVTGADPKGIRKLLDRRLRCYLLELGQRLCLECSGGYLVLYHFDKIVPAQEIKAFLRRAQRIYAALLQPDEQRKAFRVGVHSLRRSA
jgi:hypothetical protein